MKPTKPFIRTRSRTVKIQIPREDQIHEV